MHPIDQMSTWQEYLCAPKSTSGALYHSVTISCVYTRTGMPKARPNPKSATFLERNHIRTLDYVNNIVVYRSHLNDTIFVDQQILWFQISVEYPSLVAEEHGCRNLVQVATDEVRVHHFLCWQCVHVFLQVHWQKFEDQVEAAVFHENILKVDDVWVFQLF